LAAKGELYTALQKQKRFSEADAAKVISRCLSEKDAFSKLFLVCGTNGKCIAISS
jgi:hypothetical protein